MQGLGEDAKLELLADLVYTERKKGVPDSEIEEKLILTYGLTRVQASGLLEKK